MEKGGIQGHEVGEDETEPALMRDAREGKGGHIWITGPHELTWTMEAKTDILEEKNRDKSLSTVTKIDESDSLAGTALASLRPQ